MEDVEFSPTSEETKKPTLTFGKLILSFFIFGILSISALAYYAHSLNQPAQFSGQKSVLIEEGDSVTLITQKLEAAGVVKSAEFLYLLTTLNFDTTQIKASRYVFDEPLTTYEVAQRLIKGDFDADLRSVTIFEGESREKIANRLDDQFDWFNADKFLETTTELEGKLFPDTYFVPETYSTEALVVLLYQTHQGVIEDYETVIGEIELTENEIVTLASIVEREANTDESMKLVAGIFLNRLEIGMALQADVSIEYVLEHELNELRPGQLAESLREIDSPYNTYLYPGLPPTPIGNPGRAAIEAVLYPTPSEYLYYLTGNDGEFYYSENYQEHLRNIDRYLK